MRCSISDPETLRSIRQHVAAFLSLAFITLSVPVATQSFAQTGKVEKPNITFGVFPITNYGVVYLSIQQGSSRLKDST
jgi:hypothetical protein